MIFLVRMVLWKKATRAMRAMRGNTLETVPSQPCFGCAESFLKTLSTDSFASSKSYESKAACNRSPLQMYFGFH